MPVTDSGTALSIPSLPALPNPLAGVLTPSTALQDVLASFPSPNAAEATAVVIPGAPVQSTPAPASNSIFDFNRWLNGGVLIQKPNTPATTASGLPVFTFGRVAAFILGIIFVGIGLLMFKPAQQIIARGVRTVT